MRFDRISYDLDLAEDERCFYHRALKDTHKPMCLGVTDRAVFIARERFLKLQAYTMHRIPLETTNYEVFSALCRDILGEFDFEMRVSYLQIFPQVDAPFAVELQHISELPGCVEDFHRLDVN